MRFTRVEPVEAIVGLLATAILAFSFAAATAFPTNAAPAIEQANTQTVVNAGDRAAVPFTAGQTVSFIDQNTGMSTVDIAICESNGHLLYAEPIQLWGTIPDGRGPMEVTLTNTWGQSGVLDVLNLPDATASNSPGDPVLVTVSG